ncbi:Zinc phosphodiesterase ELAC protein 1, partial [Anas platyrhynchos]
HPGGEGQRARPQHPKSGVCFRQAVRS